MELLVGAGLALAVGLLASVVGLDRDRTFYPTVMIVIASYYGLFAALAAHGVYDLVHARLIENRGVRASAR